MSVALRERLRMAFAPPRYLVPPLAGIDISTSGIKAVRLGENAHGLTLDRYAQVLLPAGAFTDGEIVDRIAIVKGLSAVAKEARISSANAALSESKSYLFETTVPGIDKAQWNTAIEQHLEELVPLPPPQTTFDMVPVGLPKQGKGGVDTSVVGIGFARRIVDDTLAVLDEAGLGVRAFESENFAAARALLPLGDQSTALIIDVGKTTTKVCVVQRCIPRFATTIGVGGNALTLAVQKYFGVSEIEAKQVKAERGIIPAAANEEYLAAMLSTVSAIRDEISNRFEYWQATVTQGGLHEPITHAILTGGNASLRGFPEYLENALHVPVVTGDVFTNFAPRDTWFPSIEYNESLAFATAIGLALYDYTPV